MSKRKLSRRQRWRIEKIQEQRAERAARRSEQADTAEREGDLGREQQGLVIAHYGTQVAVEPLDDHSQNRHYRCHIRANLGSLVTGDRVVWRAGDPTGVVVAVLPRHSQLSRPDRYGEMKTIAANIDRIVLVIAPYPSPQENLIDRYLVAAENLHIQPLLLLNKVDRIESGDRERLLELQLFYKQLGYEWLNVSAREGEGMGQLKQLLADYTSVFVGQSGVGKSSLINALLPGQDLRIGPLSELTQQGTHTTTTAQLYHFPAGGYLIDSPGVREFGLWQITIEQLLAGFVEFQPFIGHCRFRDCSHDHEPGCALLSAERKGAISSRRMNSFRSIRTTLEAENGAAN